MVKENVLYLWSPLADRKSGALFALGLVLLQGPPTSEADCQQLVLAP